jgi:hypothetical protein
MIRRAVRKQGLVAMPWAFALPIKMRVGAEERFTIDEVLKKPPHVRDAFQIGGTEKGRDVYGDDYWVNQLIIGLAMMYDEEPDLDLVTVVDARFPNELAYINDHGGYTIWIDSDRTNLEGVQQTHRSETSVDLSQFDFVLKNNKSTTLENLQVQVDVLLDTLARMGALP